MYKMLIDIREEDDIIIDEFKGNDTVTVDDLLDKIVELKDEIKNLEEEIIKLKQPQEEDEEDLYEDIKLGLI